MNVFSQMCADSRAYRLSVKQRIYKQFLYSKVTVVDMLPKETPKEQVDAVREKMEFEQKTALREMYQKLKAHYHNLNFRL